MKQLRTIVFVAMALALTLGISHSVTLAQGQFPGYTSGIQVQNLSSEQANITLDFYKADGTKDNTVSDTINGNSSKTYFGTTLPVSQGFSGSAVISSDKPVAAISNLVNSAFTAGAAYVGSSQGTTSVNLPLLMKGNSGFNTWFSVQNAGSGAANVTVNYSDGTSATASIPVGSAKTFYQAQENHSEKVFSGKITSDQPVVAVVLEEDAKTMFAYSGFTAGSTNPVLPLINSNNANTITGVQIQNTGTDSTEVTLSYTPTPGFGTACTETQTIAAGKSATFALFAFSPSGSSSSNCTPGQRFVGSAQVTKNTTNQPLAVIVNQLNSGVFGEAYGGFDPANANQTVVMPLIMDRNSGYFTGFNVMNVGSVATDVNCTFTNTSYTAQANLSPGEAMNDIQLKKIADKYVGSATCTASASNAKIVGVVNELKENATNDQLLTYEAFNP